MLQKINYLIENKKYAKLRDELSELNVADVAVLFEEQSSEEIVKIFRLLPKTMAAEIFSYLPLEEQQEIINMLSDKEAAKMIDHLFADDAADLMEEMPSSVVTRILANTEPETRRDINHLLQYPEYSAGSIMTVEFVDLKEYITVEQAIKNIRRDGVDKVTIDYCFVLNQQRVLLGIVSLRKLLLSEPDEIIKNIMHENVVTISTMTDQEEVAHTFQKYDFHTMPVVDSENRLVGIITVDDVVDIMQQEATEDIEKMAAITPTDKPYMKTGIFETWRKRIPWLLLLMISATFTGKIIQYYEEALATYVILTSFIPMFMDTGGNAGGQTSVTIIRGISLNEIALRDLWRIIWRELRVGILAGVTLAAANFVKLMLVDQVSIPIAIVVCLTLIITVVLANFTGCILPLLAKKIGFDPAVMASPFITTIVDALSLIIYFAIASKLLAI